MIKIVPISITMTNSDIVKSVRFNISESMKAEDIRMRILRENIVHDVGVEKEDPVAGTDTVTITIYYLYDNKYIYIFYLLFITIINIVLK